MSSALGPMDEHTRRRAALNTLVEGLRTLGVTVSASSYDEQRLDGGRDSQRVVVIERVEREPIEVRGAEIVSCWDGELDGYRAAVAIPGEEWRRLERVERGGVLLVVACETRPAGGCGAELERALRDVVAASGLQVRASQAPPGGVDADSGAEVARFGAGEGAAHVLWIDVQAEHRHDTDGVRYAYATVDARLVETSDGRTVKTARLEDVKGAMYAQLEHVQHSKLDAVEKALEEAVAVLRRELQGW